MLDQVKHERDFQCPTRNEFRSRLVELLGETRACDDCVIDQLTFGLVTLARIARKERQEVHDLIEMVWDAMPKGRRYKMHK